MNEDTLSSLFTKKCGCGRGEPFLLSKHGYVKREGEARLASKGSLRG
jgi:hypothetical protein